MIVFESIAVSVGLLLMLSHLIERIPVQRGVLLGIAAGLGFGISDVAIKALSGDLDGGPVGLLSPWSAVIVTAAVFSFYASARSLQIGDGVAVIAVTSVAANLSTIVAGLAVFGDRLGTDPFLIGVRVAAFALILAGAALIPAPVRAGEALSGVSRSAHPAARESRVATDLDDVGGHATRGRVVATAQSLDSIGGDALRRVLQGEREALGLDSHGSPSGRGSTRRCSWPSTNTVMAIRSWPHQNSALPSVASSGLTTMTRTGGIALRGRELLREPVVEADLAQERAVGGDERAVVDLVVAEVPRLRVGHDLCADRCGPSAPGGRARPGGTSPGRRPPRSR